MSRYSIDGKPAAKTSFLLWLVPLVAVLTGGAYYLLGREPAPAATDSSNDNQQLSIALAIPEPAAPPAVEPSANGGQAVTTANVPGQPAAAPFIEQPPANPTADFVLPELKNSDTIFKEDVAKLSPGLGKWLNTDQLISRVLKLINDFSQGQRTFKNAGFLRLDTPFAPKRNEYGFFMDAKDYKRYDQFAAAVEALDVQACMAFYKKYRPLMQEVFATFGYPHAYHIEDILQKAGANILTAPLIDRSIGLVPHGNRFRFADPQLEGLDPVQKQMLRMGPENTKRIQDKVRLLLQALAA